MSKLTPNSQGQYRYLLTVERDYSDSELAGFLREDPRLAKYPIPTKVADGPPTQLLKYDTSRAREQLGIEFTPPRQTMVDGALALIELGMVPKP